MTDPEDPTELRPLLFSIAYRMLGSVTEAEDTVQAAYLRYFDYLDRGSEADSPRSLLTTITTRLAIDHLRSARVRRETYIGPWLPEPLLTSADPDVAELAATSDSLSMAFLVLLETLSPVERAVFLLREVFAYDYDDIARIVGKEPANCRQLLNRARRHIEAGRHRFDVDAAHRAELADRFFHAAEDGDLDDLVQLLAADVAFYGDGGGTGRGLPRPVFGRDRVQRVLAGIVHAYHGVGARLQRSPVNGQPGLLAFDPDGALINVLTIDVEGDSICTVRSVINPDKLGHLGFPLSPLARRATR
ncbi:RNA polymerase subunit sigma-24 [Mycobacterium sp. 852013-50091_SCH5140682]|uniref:RNA polymerase sigma-70 factor n=1 Tax=Mycobacterium sp. 852013-50091_SCH5140682 TaxID=1834109 RepID=UPI0007EB3213|nr:RNA polymerase sigma-70 factor [Mycobacterium sp. 852013-50091_SCH5140682]OBC16315.1 RNA polymerase subunit sigma-24 [Mycobacterium sp. 852013-50091_SCH5140682]